jgi:hypothetical protein
MNHTIESLLRKIDQVAVLAENAPEVTLNGFTSQQIVDLNAAMFKIWTAVNEIALDYRKNGVDYTFPSDAPDHFTKRYS